MISGSSYDFYLSLFTPKIYCGTAFTFSFTDQNSLYISLKLQMYFHVCITNYINISQLYKPGVTVPHANTNSCLVKLKSSPERLRSKRHSDFTLGTCTGRNEGYSATSLAAFHWFCYLLKISGWLQGWDSPFTQLKHHSGQLCACMLSAGACKELMLCQQYDAGNSVLDTCCILLFPSFSFTK